MTMESAARLTDVRRWSGFLCRLFKLLFWLTAASLIVQFILILIGDETFGSVRIGLTTYPGGSVPPAARVVSWIDSLAVIGILLKLSFHLKSLFARYAEGEIFGRENVRQIRQIGLTVLLFPALWILVAITPAFITADGRTALMDYDGAGPLPEIVLGGIILVVSWIMDVGRDLREEQDLWI